MQTAIADGYQEMFTKLDLTRVEDKMELIKLLAERDFILGARDLLREHEGAIPGT